MTAVELEQKIQELLGSTGSSIASGTMQHAIDSALDDLARRKPRISYEVVQLNTGQAVYQAPASAYNVLDVVFPDMSGQTPDSVWFNEFASVGNGDLSTFHSHSLAVIIAQKWEQFDNRYGYDWEYDLDSNSVIVMPAPASTSKMLLKVAHKRTLEEVPESLIAPVQELAIAESMRLVAMSIGNGITSIPIGIGNVTFNADTLVKQATEIRKQALEKIGYSGGGSVIIG